MPSRRCFPAVLPAGLLLTCLLSVSLPRTSWAQGGGAAPVQVALVEESTSTTGKSFLGTVTPVRRSIVGSAVDGRVERMEFEQGDRVEYQPGSSEPPGQVLVRLRTGTVAILVAAARAQLELRQQELNELKNGSRKEDVARAKALMDAAQAVKELAGTQLERVRELFEGNGSVSKQEFDEALSQKLATEQQYIAAKANHDLVVAGPRPEEIAQAIAQLAVAQEEVNRLEDRMEKYTIRTPFTGYVAAKHTEVGAWIKEGDQVAEIIQLDPIDVRITVPQADLSRVRLKSPASIQVLGTAAGAFEGTVERIVPQADLRSRSFPVIIRVKNPLQNGQHALKAGMLGQVTLGSGTQLAAMNVPKDALVLGGPQPIVFAVLDGKAVPLPVELGGTQGARVAVRSPKLKVGMQVVVRGNERLRPGQPVQILNAGP